MILRPPRSTLFPYTTRCRSEGQPHQARSVGAAHALARGELAEPGDAAPQQRIPERPRLEHEPEQRPLRGGRSEEHTSELQSRQYLVCRLLLEKKKMIIHHTE